MEKVFKALADKQRLKLLDSLNTNNGQSLSALCEDATMSRQAITRHLSVLEKANLVVTIWVGREKLHYINPIPLQQAYDRWLKNFDQNHIQTLLKLKENLETKTYKIMTTKPDFIYVVFIQTTPEQLWKALLDPEMTKQFWGRHRNVSDWKVGSTWEHQDYDDSSVVDVIGKVVESEENKKLVLTWATTQDAKQGKNQSEVTFEIIPFMDIVQLKVTHKGLSDEAYQGAFLGWASVLSSLKSLLETGKPLDVTTRRWKG